MMHPKKLVELFFYEHWYDLWFIKDLLHAIGQPEAYVS